MKRNLKIGVKIFIVILAMVLFYYPIWWMGGDITSYLNLLFPILGACTIFIAPIVRCQKRAVKILSATSLFLTTLSMLLTLNTTSLRGSEGWEIIAILFINILWILLVMGTTFLALIIVASYNTIANKKGTQPKLISPIIFKFILPFFYIILIIGSALNIIGLLVTISG